VAGASDVREAPARIPGWVSSRYHVYPLGYRAARANARASDLRVHRSQDSYSYDDDEQVEAGAITGSGDDAYSYTESGGVTEDTTSFSSAAYDQARHGFVFEWVLESAERQRHDCVHDEGRSA
jgi:hypothetical protein